LCKNKMHESRRWKTRCRRSSKNWLNCGRRQTSALHPMGAVGRSCPDSAWLSTSRFDAQQASGNDCESVQPGMHFRNAIVEPSGTSRATKAETSDRHIYS
jgi:hypothetical protein